MPGFNNTEDDISNFIDDHFDTKEPVVGDNTDNSAQADAGADNGGQQQQQDGMFRADNAPVDKTAPNADKTNDKQGTQQQPQAKDQQSQQGDKTADPASLRPLRGGVFADNKGNIVDRAGQIVARAGKEARLYTGLASTRNQLEQAQTKIRELEQNGTTSQALNGLPARLGLNTEDVTAALDMAAKVRQGKVVEVAKDILAMLTAQGHNVTDLLGGDVGDSIEMKAIKRMMDERFAPIDQQRQQSQQEEQVRTAAVSAYNDFLDTNEYAELHADDIALVMREEGLKPQQAYNKLMHFVARNGLDPAQPLEPQIRARQTQQPAQQQPTQQRQQNHKPMINGVRGNGGTNVASAPMASADDSWADIIKQAQASM